MTFSRSWRGAVFGVVLGLTAGCTGGQSGSEGPDSFACPDPISLGANEAPPSSDGRVPSPSETLATIAGPTTIDGVWLSTEAHHPLTIEISRVPSGATWRPCEYLIDTTVTVRTDDGAIDTTARVRISVGAGVKFTIALPELPSAVVEPPLWAPDEAMARAACSDIIPLGDPSPSPTLSVDLVPPSRAVLMQDGRALGLWITKDLPLFGPPTLYTPPPELESSCVGADQYGSPPGWSGGTGTERETFPSAEAAFAVEIGTWARCADNTAFERAGVQILPDATWRDVAVEAGALVALSGFDHEGFANVGENQPSGTFDLLLPPHGGAPVSNHALVFPAISPDWPSAVYLPTTLSVQAHAPLYADGERAGAAACDVVEQGIVPTHEGNVAALDGTFTLCSGSLGTGVTGIRFGGGRVDLLGSGGGVLRSSSYEVDSQMGGRFATVLGDVKPGAAPSLDWVVMASRFPRKLRIEPAEGSPAILSAVP